MRKKVAKRIVAIRKKIIRPSDLPWPSDWDITTVGLSQSKYSEWSFCKRAFLFSLNGYIVPATEEKTNFGSIVHEVQDEVYTRGRYPTNKEIVSYIDSYCEKRIKDGSVVTHQQVEFDAAKAQATLIPYYEFYEKDFKTKKFTGCEILFNERFCGATHRGKIDGRYNAKDKTKWLREFKTKGRVNENALLKYLNLDFQNQFYIVHEGIMTGEIASGMLYEVIRNTEINKLKNETLKEYMKKVMEACRKNPEHFYKRWQCSYPKENLQIFKNDLGYTIDEIKFKQGMHVCPNTFNCLKPWPCQFLRACSEDSMRSLTKVDESIEERMFPELKEKNNGSNTNNSVKKTAKRIVAKRVKTKK